MENIDSGVVGQLSKQGGQLGALGHLLMTGDVSGAMTWLVGGAAASKVQRETAKRLLNNDRFMGWVATNATDPAKTFTKEAIGSLTALAAQAGADPQFRSDVGELIDAINPDDGKTLGTRAKDAFLTPAPRWSATKPANYERPTLRRRTTEHHSTRQVRHANGQFGTYDANDPDPARRHGMPL
jgi:hypothetical protein